MQKTEVTVTDINNPTKGMTTTERRDSQTPSCEVLVAHQICDARGLRCPLPLLQAKKALKTLEVSQVLCVLSTDPSAKGDFDAMLSHLPHQLIDYRREQKPNGEYPWVDSFFISKGE